MPLITYVNIQAAAAGISTSAKALAPGIKARLSGGKIYIDEGNTTVFHIEVRVVNGDLELDYPRTSDDDLRRGWAKVGAALALEYGLAQGCATASVGTLIESTGAAAGFWAMVKVQKGTPRRIADIQADINFPAVLGVADPVVAKGRARSSSLGK
jgi:hypothetical protein